MDQKGRTTLTVELEEVQLRIGYSYPVLLKLVNLNLGFLL